VALTDVAVGWLTDLSPEGPWWLYASDENSFKFERFTLNRLDAMRDWLEKRHGRANIYYSPNTPLPTIAKHPKKTEIVFINFIHVDLDLPDGQPTTQENLNRLLFRIQALRPAPHLLVFSGGGYQALWRLTERLPADEWIERVEATNREIEKQISGDHCFNVNRILRVPGTINIPNAKKLAKHPGRLPTLATIVSADWSARWSYATDPVPRLADDFIDLPTAAEDDDQDEPDEDGTIIHHRPRELGSLSRKLQRAIKTGDTTAYMGDRSRLVLFIVASLVRLGWNDAEITPFILDPQYPSSAHCRAKPTPAREAQRQIDKVRRKVAEDWLRNEDGGIRINDPRNIRKGIDLLGLRFSHDKFSDQPYVNGAGPLQPLSDSVANSLRVSSFITKHDFIPSKDMWYDVIADLAESGAYHPVCDYLNDAREAWDARSRIDSWLFDYGEVKRKTLSDFPEDNPVDGEARAERYNRYVSAVGRLMLVAACRRVRRPGEKFDEMTVFVNPKQGTNKSSALAILAVRKDWFIDSLPLHARDQEVIEKLSGKWIVEFAEMNGLRTSDLDHLKAFLSRDTDHARKAYGRFVSHPKRQCVFFGSTNEPAFLRDTEDRRFWPIRVGRFDLDALRRDRDQLWGEASAAEATGESIRLDQKLWGAAAEVQTEHRIEDPWVTMLQEYLGDQSGRITAFDAWKLINKPGYQRTQEDNRRFGVAIRTAGWERVHTRVGERLQWCYVRGETQVERSKWLMVFTDPFNNTVTVSGNPPLDDHSPQADPPF